MAWSFAAVLVATAAGSAAAQNEVDPSDAPQGCAYVASSRPSVYGIQCVDAGGRVRPIMAPNVRPGMFRDAEAGDTSAMVRVGGFYTARRWGDDVKTGLDWYRRAADAGDAMAMYRLAQTYRWGEGVPADPVASVDWYRRAVGAGYKPAATEVGVAYASGSGVEKDEAEARRWYRIAVESGSSLAGYQLAKMLLEGRGGPKDPAEAARILTPFAADRTHPEHMCLLSEIYRQGNGVPQDVAEADRLAARASEVSNVVCGRPSPPGIRQEITLYPGG